jgi:hypothetical protein
MRLVPVALAFLVLSGSPAFSPADEPPSKDQPKDAKKASSVALSADGKRALTGSSDTGSADNTMRLWQVPR